MVPIGRAYLCFGGFSKNGKMYNTAERDFSVGEKCKVPYSRVCKETWVYSVI